MKAKLNDTWVLPAAGTPKGEMESICAYYTLSVCDVERETLPDDLGKRYPNYPFSGIYSGAIGGGQALSGAEARFGCTYQRVTVLCDVESGRKSASYCGDPGWTGCRCTGGW